MTCLGICKKKIIYSQINICETEMREIRKKLNVKIFNCVCIDCHCLSLYNKIK